MARLGDNDRLTIRVPARMRQELRDASRRDGVGEAEWARRALSYALRRGGVSPFKEILLHPKGDSTVDSYMTWLCARTPLLKDLLGAGGEFSGEVRRAMQVALTPQQFRRIELVIVEDLSFEEIGKQEGCSRQAVHASVMRGLGMLGVDAGFLRALCAQFPDSGMTPAMLEQAARTRRSA